MTPQPRNFWRNLLGAGRRESEAAPAPASSRPRASAPAVEIVPAHDPLAPAASPSALESLTYVVSACL